MPTANDHPTRELASSTESTTGGRGTTTDEALDTLLTALSALTRAGFLITYKAASIHSLQHEPEIREWSADGAAVALGELIRRSKSPSWPSEDRFSEAVAAVTSSIERSWVNYRPTPHWMRPALLTASGALFDIFAGARSRPSIYVLAKGISNECRFAGQCDFYSVAQHLVLASYVVPPEDAYPALMHDISEGLIKDIPKPLKVLLPDYQAIERLVERGLYQHFGVPPMPDSVKIADTRLFATEMRDLMPRGHDESWVVSAGIEPLRARIRPWSPRWAQYRFLCRYVEVRYEKPSFRLRLALLAHIYLPSPLRPPAPELDPVHSSPATVGGQSSR